MVFDRLKKAFKKFVENVSSTIAAKELSEEELEPLVEELLMELVECDVAFEAAEAIVNDLKKKLIGKRVPRFSDTRKLVVDALKEALEDLLGRAYVDKNLVSEALSRRGEPIKIVFFGVNGVGKTTTIAKFAYMFRKAGITPVIAAADTYRAGAQEQLRVHAEKIKVPFIGSRYGADPAAVAYDAIEYAKARGYRVVLIDTAGRMHTDSSLMEELRKVVRVVKPDYKILVVDALTGNDAVEQARFFEEAVGVDYIVLTKVDADVKGGTAISLAYAIGKPILYVGVGQKYEDLEKFDPRSIVEKILEGLSG